MNPEKAMLVDEFHVGVTGNKSGDDDGHIPLLA